MYDIYDFDFAEYKIFPTNITKPITSNPHSPLKKRKSEKNPLSVLALEKEEIFMLNFLYWPVRWFWFYKTG
jgi:hypothetical protein